MKSVLERDKKRRLLFKKFEIRRLILKSLLVEQNLESHEKNFIRYLLSKIPKDSSLTRIRNRCIVTGRGRGVFSKFRLSRIVFKKYSLMGNIYGVRKH
jgi:succinate dehydrogenase (ubiquinone) iron-sulfur subunit